MNKIYFLYLFEINRVAASTSHTPAHACVAAAASFRT